MKATIISLIATATGAFASPFPANSGALASPNVNNHVLSVEGCNAEQKSAIEAAFAQCAVITKKMQFFHKAEMAVVTDYFGGNAGRTIVNTFRKVGIECKKPSQRKIVCGSNKHQPCRTGQAISADESGLPTTTHTHKAILFCPAFFMLPPSPEVCHGKSQSTAVIQQLASSVRLRSTNDKKVQKVDHEGTSSDATPWASYANGKS